MKPPTFALFDPSKPYWLSLDQYSHAGWFLFWGIVVGMVLILWVTYRVRIYAVAKYGKRFINSRIGNPEPGETYQVYTHCDMKLQGARLIDITKKGHLVLLDTRGNRTIARLAGLASKSFAPEERNDIYRQLLKFSPDGVFLYAKASRNPFGTPAIRLYDGDQVPVEIGS